MKGFIVILALAAVAAANQCPAEQAHDISIEKLLPHPDCTKFFKCAYGHPVEQLCPSYLYYNINAETCDYQENVDCGDRIDPHAPVAPAPEGQESASSENNGSEPQENNNPEPQENNNPEPQENNNPEPENSGFLPNGCPVNGEVHYLLPHETNKNQFYQCVWGRRVLLTCPAGLVFDAWVQVCARPATKNVRMSNVRFVN